MTKQMCGALYENKDNLEDKRKIFVIKSTCTPQTYEKVRQVMDETLKELSSNVALLVNPETLAEGEAMENFRKPEGIAIGGYDEEAIAELKELYDPIVKTGVEMRGMDPHSAHLAKYANNTHLAAQISQANNYANLCDRLNTIYGWDTNVEDVLFLVRAEKKRQGSFNKVGIGFGGSCFDKDTEALDKMAQAEGLELPIVRAAYEINAQQKLAMVYKIRQVYGVETLEGLEFGMWGLAFKPYTDDIRNSPALDMATEMLKQGAKISSFDESAMPNSKRELESRLEPQQYANISFEETKLACLEKAENGLIVALERPYREIATLRLASGLGIDTIFDCKNCLSPHEEEAKRLGLNIIGIGWEAKYK